jgi:hypothetical protein
MHRDLTENGDDDGGGDDGLEFSDCGWQGCMWSYEVLKVPSTCDPSVGRDLLIAIN